MKNFIFFACILLISYNALAQVKIGDNPTTINGSSLLELESSSSKKGLLLPRVALANTTTWDLVTNTPVNGMIVYNTNALISSSNSQYPIITGGIGVYYWDGTGWVAANSSQSASQYWSLTGNAGTVDGTNFLGTTDNVPLTIRVNNAQSGRIDNTRALTFWGYQAGLSNTVTNNHFIGFQAGYSNTTGTPNHFEGYRAGYNNTSGIRNTAVGYQALMNNTTGTTNTALGYLAGITNTTGLYNTFIGSAADASAGSLINAAAIGYSATVSRSNAMVLGGTGGYAVNVGIGTSSPSSTLQVIGSFSANIVNTTGPYTLTGSDYTVIYTGSTNVTFTLPGAGTCKGRIYRMVNASINNSNIYLSLPVYLFNGSTETQLTANYGGYITGNVGESGGQNTVTIQSDGANWWRVGL